jgi:hypothetical protein
VSVCVHGVLAAGEQRNRQVTSLESETVTTDVLVDGAFPARTRRTMLRLHWSSDDPIAVSMQLSARPDHPALPRGEWFVLRDFLRYGLDEPTGDGDVRIVPQESGTMVRLELCVDGRLMPVQVARATLCDFLDRTEAIQPSGEAGEEAALDALVDRLLAGE